MCPWIDWQPATMKFCENLLCGSIRQPANTISNAAFIICGLILMKSERKQGNFNFDSYYLMAIASIMIGITSGVYHASMTFFWQFFDVSSMFMLILIALTFNFIRLKWIKSSMYIPTYLGMLLFSMMLMLLIKGKSGEYIFGVEVTLTILTEYLIFKSGAKVIFRPFLQAIGIFLLSFLIWNGDIRGWWCDPDNHYIQGHAIWHVLNAVAIWYLYKFYKQFQKI